MSTRTRGRIRVQHGGHVEPARPGQADVEQRDVGFRPAGGLDHLVATPDLGHHLDVLL
jgi:hypothetical protein